MRVISPAGFSGKGLLAAGSRHGEENPLTQQAGNQVRVKTVCLQKENAMADDKTKTDARDRSRVAGAQEYEVEYFAAHHGISTDQAKALIEKFGNDRKTLMREVARLKG